MINTVDEKNHHVQGHGGRDMRDTHINNLLVSLIMSATLRCQVQRFYSFLTKRCVCVCVRARFFPTFGLICMSSLLLSHFVRTSVKWEDKQGHVYSDVFATVVGGWVWGKWKTQNKTGFRSWKLAHLICHFPDPSHWKWNMAATIQQAHAPPALLIKKQVAALSESTSFYVERHP